MKKLICLILSLILVLGMAVSAFAATSLPPGTINPAPSNKPTQDPDIPVLFNNPGVKDITPDDVEDENPNTGAPVLLVPAMLVAVGAVASFSKKR